MTDQQGGGEGVKQLKERVQRIVVAVNRVPADQRVALLEKLVNELPENERDIVYAAWAAQDSAGEEERTDRAVEDPKFRRKLVVAGFVAGLAFILLLVATAFWIPIPSSYQRQVFRIVLALFAGMAATGVSGMLDVKYDQKVPGGRWAIRGTAGFAVFLVVFFWNPAE